jgi:peptidoglycan/xylan/chitin deacetylase (PgdA/CDA1 family)
MTRREFAAGLGATILHAAPPPAPRVAITMDDFQWRRIPDPAKANQALLDTFARHANLQAAIFVCGQNVDDPTGRQLLRAWSDAGHLIGNHTYSHLSYNSPQVGFSAFSADLLRGEAVVNKLPAFRKMFRFPFLHEGQTEVKRDRMRRFLAQHGYRNGHVTIDNSDWYYDQRLRQRLLANPHEDTKPYRDAYLDHIWDRTTYYDGIAQTVLHRTVPHTLLLHYTYLNSLFLHDLLTMFETKGWQLLSAKTAYEDAVFQSNPDVLPAGESLLWSLAKAADPSASILRYPGEGAEYEKAKLDRLGL